MHVPRAIIDFAGPPDDARLVFTSPAAEFVAHDRAGVEAALRDAESAALDGAWVAGFLAYEAAPGLDASLTVRAGCRTPLAWFAAFDEPRREPIPARSPGFPAVGRPAVPSGWRSSEHEGAHAAAVARVREAIGRGDVYQVNHTFRLRSPLTEDPLATYERLVRATPAPYAAYLRLPPHHVVSISPELFFRRDGRRLTVRPMKGTAPRGRWQAEDERAARALAESAKDRAENLMIVDLLRNDLGRVAELGSVRVSDLYRIETHPTVHQMTSTVRACARAGAGLLEVLRALFPCGSVTGAPKIAAMRMISALEKTPREAYCGTVGFVRPGGDCVFNVAIRTALADETDGTLTYGAGGGITWSSDAAAEWAEAIGKAAILRPVPAAGDLVETLRVERGTAVRWNRHRDRLLASAAALGHRVDRTKLEGAVAGAAAARADAFVLRVAVSAGGDVSASTRAPAGPGAMRARPAPRPVRSDDPRLFHKTSDRTVYDELRAGLAEDEEVLLWNERGHATEFARGNLVIDRGGRLVTPAVNAGLLPGVFRDELVRTGTVAEAVVAVEELRRTAAVWFVNSARGWVPVRWNPSGEAGVAP